MAIVGPNPVTTCSRGEPCSGRLPFDPAEVAIRACSGLMCDRVDTGMTGMRKLKGGACFAIGVESHGLGIQLTS